MSRPHAALTPLALVTVVLSGCNGTGSGGAGSSGSSDPNDTIRQIKAEEAQLERQLEAGRREAQGTWGDSNDGFESPDDMGYQSRP